MSAVTDVPGEWLKVAMRAWVDGEGDLRQVLAAVAPLIAAQERERCALVAESVAPWGMDVNPRGVIAAAIRALKETT